jgi:hypothetical protein
MEGVAVLVAHCVFSGDHRWELWAEDAARFVGLPRAGGRRSTVVAPGRHPFAVAAGELMGHFAVPAGEAGSSVLALPSRGGRPCPSADLYVSARLPVSRAATADHIAPWVVPTLIVDAPVMARVLAQESGWVEGATVRYARVVSGIAAHLTGTGQVLPSMEWDDGSQAWSARWLPAPSVGASALRRRMAESMPPALRCWLADDDLTGLPPFDVYDGALAGLVDAGVRETLAGAVGSLVPAQRGRMPRVVPGARRLLAALVPADQRVGGDEEQLQDLASALDAWRSGGPAAGPGAVGLARTCFRLRPPADEAPALGTDGAVEAGDAPIQLASDGWAVDLLLQSTDDPSLLATAVEVWRDEGNAGMFTDAGIDARRELLAGLGRAAKIFPALRGALVNAMPLSVPLDAQGALDFLRRDAPSLVAGSFGVVLPSWWAQARPGVGLRLSVTSPEQPGRVDKPAAFGAEQLVAYRWHVALGDQPLTGDELAALAAAKAPLVRVRGQWVEVDQRRLAEGLKFLAKSGRRTMTVGDVLRTGLFGSDDSDAGLPVAGVDASGWLGDVLAGSTGTRYEPVPTPAGFGAALRPYQERGLGWLAFMDSVGLGAVLADDMGLGKTIQVLALLEGERQQRPDVAPTLLVCPMSLVANWQREAARFAPKLSVHVHHGAERLTGEEFRAVAAGAHLVLTTFGLALRDRHELAEVAWHRLVVDEAQAIKNSAAKQSHAVRSLSVPHRIALTGTPVENRLADLHAIMEFASPGLLGSAEAFKRRFATPIERDGDTEAAARLRRATGAFVLRRVKTDPSIISDLPEKVEMTVLCNLTKEQAALYQAVVDDMLRQIAGASGMNRRGLVLATLTKLKQVCNHPAQFLKDHSRIAGRSGKLARIEEICEEILVAGEKVLLFTQYAEFGAMLADHLSARFDSHAAFLHGGVAKKTRDAMVAAFQEPDGPPVFVLSLKAGGVGLNLTAANHVIHADRWWNPAVEAQATDRAFRIGQRRDVQVRKLMCAGTLEERIDRVLAEKQALAEAVVGAGEAWLTELSTEALREMVTLARDAVVE